MSWIDFFLHCENDTRSTAEELSKDPLSIPSIARQAQYENLEAVVERVHHDADVVNGWCEVEKKHISRKRQGRRELIVIEDADREEWDWAA